MQVNEVPVQQAAAAKVTRPLPSLSERGVAMPRGGRTWLNFKMAEVITN